METISIKTLEEFISATTSNYLDWYQHTVLFRGQSGNWPLLPSIGRNLKNFTMLSAESKMIEELKRHSGLILERQPTSYWEWLILGQHYGLKTRLLDWTTNPLAALWFACSDMIRLRETSFVYILNLKAGDYLTIKDDTPFQSKYTGIIFPNSTNARVAAQIGHFTAFAINGGKNEIIPLEVDPYFNQHLSRIEIEPKQKEDIILKLNTMGINWKTVYPDLDGLCRHLNWLYTPI
jgi:hypothetical protein